MNVKITWETCHNWWWHRCLRCRTTAFDNGVAGHEFGVRVKSSECCLVWLSWQASGEPVCLKTTRAEIPGRRSTELSGWKTVRAWPRPVADGERTDERHNMFILVISYLAHSQAWRTQSMFAGRINTNWLIIDGGGGVDGKIESPVQTWHLYIGKKTPRKNTGERRIMGEGLMRSALCTPSLKLVELR